MQFFGKIWQNRMLAPPPGELAPPPRGNPRSATALCIYSQREGAVKGTIAKRCYYGRNAIHKSIMEILHYFVSVM